MPLELSLEALIIHPCSANLYGQKSSTNIGRIHTVRPIKIQINPSKPHPRLNQYPISKEVFQDIKPITEAYKTQGFIIP